MKKPYFPIDAAQLRSRTEIRLLWLFSLFLLAQPALGKGIEVRAGILDLRAEPLTDSRGLVEFNGPWLFVPHVLLETAAATQTDPLYADPALFWQETQQDIFQRAERGTFFLTIQRIAGQEQLSLFLTEMPQYRLYANGRLIATQGSWNADGSSSPQRGHKQIPLPDTETIHLTLQTDMNGPRWQPWPQAMNIGTVSAVQSWVQRHTIMLALILGGIFVTGVYHVLLFVLNHRKKAPLILGLFCLAHVLRNVLGSEIDTVFHIWPDFSYEWSYKLGYTAFFAVAPLYVHFLYCSFHGTLPLSFVWGYWLFASAFIALTLVAPVSVYTPWSQLYHLALIGTIIVMLLCLVRSLKQRLEGAYTLLTGTLILIVATLNDIFFFRGTLKTGEIVPFAVFIFIHLQATILSSQVAAAFRELQHTYKELTKIAHLHMVQRIAAGYRVEQTMPTGTANGTVIAFDIVSSSRIRHPQFHEVLERMMGRCYAAMSVGYNPSTLECRAYRIKEMGDGLLCSVGFPFHLPQSNHQATEALRLAEDFTQIFREEIATLGLPHDVYCGIGIASGPIEGFFPRFGIKQYDLRGRTIMLANRYESMRNQVFQLHGLQGSVIFIQDEVYKQLSKDDQATFQLWDCTLEQQRIRDDPQATRAWFRFVEPASGQRSHSRVS